jgi:peptide/nickel transport system substrate-binding protein
MFLALLQCTSEESIPTTVPATATSTPAPTPAPTPKATPRPTATPFITPTAIPSPTVSLPPKDLERGGVLRFAIPEGPPHSDPHLTVSPALASWGVGLAYSRLFKVVTDARSSTVVCDLCQSWEQTDPLTFKIKLREDVKWQNLPPLNGRSLNAQEVVYSLNRQATTGYPNSALLSNISEIYAVGEYEILIRLESPDSEIFEKLADSHSRIVARAAVDIAGDLRLGPTVGTGPWIATDVYADATRLIINEDYYGDGVPYLDMLEIQVMPSSSVRAAGMRTKIIDLAQVSFEDVASARERFEDIRWIGIENPAAGVEIAMNTARSPMDKQAVREAMMLMWPAGKSPSIPGESSILDTFNAKLGISLGLPLINNDWLLSTGKYIHRTGTNKGATERANTLLATVALKPTDNIIIKVGEFGQEYIDQANAMAEGLESVGIRAAVERVSTRVFGDEVWTAGDYDIMIGSGPPISSTTAYLFAVQHSDGPWNTTGYSDPEVDRLIEAQAKEYDSGKRGEMLLDIQERILAGSHRFIASTRTTHWMFWDYVHDFEPFTLRGDTDFLTRVWLTN